jgi:hypothetical protein
MLQGVSVFFEQMTEFLAQQGYGWIEYEAMPNIPPEEKLSTTAQIQLQSIEGDLTSLARSVQRPDTAKLRKRYLHRSKRFHALLSSVHLQHSLQGLFSVHRIHD